MTLCHWTHPPCRNIVQVSNSDFCLEHGKIILKRMPKLPFELRNVWHIYAPSLQKGICQCGRDYKHEIHDIIDAYKKIMQEKEQM